MEENANQHISNNQETHGFASSSSRLIRLILAVLGLGLFTMFLPIPEQKYCELQCVWVTDTSLYQRIYQPTPTLVPIIPTITPVPYYQPTTVRTTTEPTITEEPAPDVTERNTPWVTFHNKTYGYHFKHPVYFIPYIQDNRHPDSAIKFDYNFFQTGTWKRQMTFLVNVIPKEQKLSLKEYMPLTEWSNKIDRMVETSVNGYEALRLDNAGNKMAYFISRNDYIVVVLFDWYEPTSVFATRPEDIFKEIMKTFSFTFTPTGIPSVYDKYIYIPQKINTAYIPQYELNNDGTTRVNSAYKYSVTIPKGWFIENDFSNYAEFRTQICKHPSEGVVVSYEEKEKLRCMEHTRTITFSLLQKNEKKLTLEQWLIETGFTFESYGIPIAYDQRQSIVNNHPAEVITPKERNRTTVNSIVYVSLNNSVLAITYYVSGELPNNEANTFEEVLNSITFN